MLARLSRFSLLGAAALIAAAVGDFTVESLANAGAFGAGYADHDQLTVVPTLLAGALLAIELAVICVVAALRRGARRDADWLLDAAGALSRPKALDLWFVLLLQLAALFVMESTEQLFEGHRLLGGTVWLGAPVAVSLAIHALIGTGCSLLLSATMRVVVAGCATLVLVALAPLVVAAKALRAFVLPLRDDVPNARAQLPHARQIGERAPPLLTAPA